MNQQPEFNAPIVEWAVWYASQGIPVFPLARRTKFPAIKEIDGGRGFKDATCHEPTIRAWWDKYRDANIGAACGFKFDVIDVDVAGLDLARQNKTTWGPVVKTPSGGRHAYVAPQSLKFLTNAIGLIEGFDIRTDGAYAVMPPSFIEEHEKGEYEGFYEWTPGHELNGHMPDPPEWFLKGAIEGKAKRKAKGGKGPAIPEDQIIKGTRNGSLFRFGCRLRAHGKEYEEILETVTLMNKERCEPPLPDRDIERIARQASKYDLPPPRRSEFDPPIIQAETPPDPPIDEGVAKSILFASDLVRAEEWVKWATPSLRYVLDRGSWVSRQEGGVWKEEPGKDLFAIHSSATFGRFVGSLATQNLPEDAAKAKALLAAAKSMESKNRIETHVSLGRSIPSICIPSSQLDAHKFLIGTQSGVVDLCTGQLVTNADDKYITKVVNCRFNPDAKCPTFERFIRQVYQERMAVIELVLSLLAYSLSGDTSRQVMVLLYGERGRNGKSTLFDVMRGVLGPGYYRTIDRKLLIESVNDNSKFSLAQLEGVRMTTATEASGSAKLDTEFLKALTGDGELFAERKGKDGYPFTPQAKLWFATNNLPYARFDPSFRDRLIPIPHTQSFYDKDNPNYQEGDLPRIEGFEAMLMAEREGIFAGLAKAFRTIYLAKGITRPPEVKELAQKYESSSDFVGTFIDEACELGSHDTHRIQASELFRHYVEFCKKMRMNEPGRYNEFISRMKLQPGIKNVKPNNKSTFTGICMPSKDAPGWWTKE